MTTALVAARRVTPRGRPRKGEEREPPARLSLTVPAELRRWLDSQRQPGEGVCAALVRILEAAREASERAE